MWPTSWSDALNVVLPSVNVDVYLEPGKDVSYQEELLTLTNADGMVCAMLGAGNHVGGGDQSDLSADSSIPLRWRLGYRSHADQAHSVLGCGGAEFARMVLVHR